MHSIKGFAIVLLPVLAALIAIGVAAHLASRPPAEAKIIASFNRNRAPYERLRDMLTADDELLRIADWGIETDAGFEKPPGDRFSGTRYDEYMALLKQANARGASRRRGKPADPCILIWASGFAGDTRHRSICWRTVAPENQVASLEAFEESPRPRKPVFKHIEGGWYIWADW